MRVYPNPGQVYRDRPLTSANRSTGAGRGPAEEEENLAPDHADHHAEQEAQTEAEVESQAAHEETDEITSREALEEELMEEGRSEEGEHIP